MGSGKLAGNLPVDGKLIMTVAAESAKPIYQHVRDVEEFLCLHGMGDLDIDAARMLFSRPAVVNVSRRCFWIRVVRAFAGCCKSARMGRSKERFCPILKKGPA